LETAVERAISASDANQKFSEMLREVQAGNSYVVTSRGRPVAKVVPIDDRDDRSRKFREMMNELGKLPRLNAVPWTRDELYERRPEDEA